MKPKFQSETDLARVVVAWLRANEWEVYQEVTAGQGSPTCDIVAKRGAITWAIECKLSLNFEVIGQAMHWIHRANYSSIAVPYRTGWGVNEGIAKLLKPTGLGWLSVRPDDRHDITLKVDVVLWPQLTRPKRDIRELLCEEQKTFAEAGNNRGERFTPFKRTCQAVVGAVRSNPGITPKDLIASINHHYGSDPTARTCIIKWVEAGSLPGVKLVREGKRITFHPTP